MGLPRISYNGRNVDFTRKIVALDVRPLRSATRNFSVSRKSETLNMNSGFSVHAVLTNFSIRKPLENDLKTALYELMQWMEDGRATVFYRDRDITVSTTLDGAAAPGAVSIPVASATGVTLGRRYAIESATEVATVEASNSGTDPVTITAALNYGFASGSRFRDFEVLPIIGILRITERGSAREFFDVEITAMVDAEDL